MAKKRLILTPEEQAWAAGYDDRTRRFLDHIARRRAEIAERQAREERRRQRPLLLRWLPIR